MYNPQVPRTRNEVNQSIPGLAAAINQILGDTSQPQEIVDAQVQNMISQINKSLELISAAAQQNRKRKIEELETANAAEMARQEKENIIKQIDDFKTQFNNLISSEEVQNLTTTQRRQLFSGLTRLTTGFFTDIQIDNQLEQDISVVNRFREVWSIMIEVIGTYVSLVKEQGPDVAKKTAAIIAAVFMLICLFGPSERDSLAASSPLIGSIIKATIIARPYIKDWFQTVASVTMIYYFLKNAGVDTSSYLETLKQFASNQLSSAGKQAINISKNALAGLTNIFTMGIPGWVTSEYTNFAFEGSQDTINSSSSVTSNISVNTRVTSNTQRKIDDLRSISTNISRFNVESIHLLLQNNEDSPVSANVVDPTQNLTDDSKDVQLRLQEIVNESESPLRYSPPPYSEPLERQVSQLSQESQPISNVSSGSNYQQGLNYYMWDINPNNTIQNQTNVNAQGATAPYESPPYSSESPPYPGNNNSPPYPGNNNSPLYNPSSGNSPPYPSSNNSPNFSNYSRQDYYDNNQSNREQQEQYDELYGDLIDDEGKIADSNVGGRIRRTKRRRNYKKRGTKRRQRKYTKKGFLKKRRHTKKHH